MTIVIDIQALILTMAIVSTMIAIGIYATQGKEKAK
jgi:hypothetical protein